MERRGTIVHAEWATHDVRIVEITPSFPFRAGQYAAIGFRDLPLRDYSMASRPGEKVLRFHVRVAEGISRVAGEVAVGEAVRLRGPFGEAVIQDRHGGPVIAAAGSTGLAPILSIVEAALERGDAVPINLFFGVRSLRDIYLEEHLRGLARRHAHLAVTIALSEAGGGAYPLGLVSDVMARTLPRMPAATAYVAGPPAMVEASAAVLRGKGIMRILADSFVGEAERARLAALGLGPKGRD
jgi:NAD(P)H-flavin reductase